MLEQQTLDRNPYLAETSSVASILDPADGGRIFGISPAQARFNRESVAYFNASCGPIDRARRPAAGCVSRQCFVCEPLTNLVHRRVLEPAGVTFVARRVEQGREFLASSDPAFRPVNLATGPDGALYVVDMYRELVEHPQFVPESARGSRRLSPLAQSRADLADPSQGGDSRTIASVPNLSKADVAEARRVAGPSQRLVAQHGAAAASSSDSSRTSQTRRRSRRCTAPDRSSQGQDQSPGRLHALWTLAAVQRDR